jgi:uncharacterized protein (DUF305 family)
MKRSLTAFAVVIAVSSSALAQADKDHQQHHPGGAAPHAQPAPTPSPAPVPPASSSAPTAQGQMPMGQMMQGMPDHCRSMMQNMQTCMGTMQQMMHGRMGGGMMGGSTGQHGSQPAPGTSAQATPPTAATKAYLEAAERMHAPMMEGVQANDPDVAFVRGMIPHHQAAIDMAKVVLQYGKDPHTRKLAEDVVREQQREITDMEEWLKKNAR